MMLAIGRRGERYICKFVCRLIYKSCLLKFEFHKLLRHISGIYGILTSLYQHDFKKAVCIITIVVPAILFALTMDAVSV